MHAGCVPPRVDQSAYPVPRDEALDNSFDLQNFQVAGPPDWHCCVLLSLMPQPPAPASRCILLGLCLHVRVLGHLAAGLDRWSAWLPGAAHMWLPQLSQPTASWGDSRSAVVKRHGTSSLNTLFSTDVRGVQGRWNITAGQNSLFDTFDCQVHDFDSPKPNFLHGQLRWRIQKSNGDFISRAGEQTFSQACLHLLRESDSAQMPCLCRAAMGVLVCEPRMLAVMPAVCMSGQSRVTSSSCKCCPVRGKQQCLAAACSFLPTGLGC